MNVGGFVIVKPIQDWFKDAARISALEAALKPFAEELENMTGENDETELMFLFTTITVGDLRRAKAALEG